jgi:hypothetical protein
MTERVTGQCWCADSATLMQLAMQQSPYTKSHTPSRITHQAASASVPNSPPPPLLHHTLSSISATSPPFCTTH